MTKDAETLREERAQVCAEMRAMWQAVGRGEEVPKADMDKLKAREKELSDQLQRVVPFPEHIFRANERLLNTGIADWEIGD